MIIMSAPPSTITEAIQNYYPLSEIFEFQNPLLRRLRKNGKLQKETGHLKTHFTVFKSRPAA